MAAGKHSVTAITRQDSQTELPSGVAVQKVDYDKHDTIVSALRGQDALVVTLSGHADIEGIEKKLIAAAEEAGVGWILPSEWGFDTANPSLIEDIIITKTMVNVREHLKSKSTLSFISISTGFWYEWSLAIPFAYGIDINNRTATLFDDGTAKISSSTWPQVGRAVASLLALPIKREDAASTDTTASLNDFKNQLVYVSSFLVSQRDMLASLYRVTDTQESDWTITSEDAKQRYHEGIEQMKQGQRVGFGKMMYTRVFWDGGEPGNVEHKVINDKLGLPKEDLDEATKRTVERARTTKNMWG